MPQRARRAGGIRGVPEARDQRAQQQLLRQTHLRMGRHFKRAQLQQAIAARRPVRRIQLVDTELGTVCIAGDIGQQVAEQRVDQPWGAVIAGLRQLFECDLEFV